MPLRSKEATFGGMHILAALVVICSLVACKKDSALKKLEDFFEYRPYTIDTTIRVTSKAKDSVFQSVIPFNFTPENQGYGFPAFIELGPKRLIMAVTQYSSVSDFLAARIVAKESNDGGKTFGPEYVLQENIGGVQTGSPSFLRTGTDEIWLFFLVKNSPSSCNVFYKVSTDNGETWGTPVRINTMEGYHIVNNARVIKSGNRIIVPVAYTSDINRYYDRQGVFCYYSDDFGSSWQLSSRMGSTIPLMEPGVTQLSGNELIMNIRSANGKILFSRSMDNGKTWSTPVMSAIDSPEAPGTMYKLGNNKLMLVWNNNNGSGPPDMRYSNRQPLTLSYSSDNGRTWSESLNVEWARGVDYCYAACYEYDGHVYLAYNVRPHSGLRIYTKMIKLR